MKKILPYVKVRDVDAYFELPKKGREKYGLYLKPYALPHEWFPNHKGEKGWKAWSYMIRKEYPIQGFVREWLFSYDNPAYAFFGIKKTQISRFWWMIKRIIYPVFPRYQKVLRRWEYTDGVELIKESNFAIILDFYFEEVVGGYVDWNSDEDHKEFYSWLIWAKDWILFLKPEMEKDLDQAYKNRRLGGDYKDVYKIQEAIDSNDDKVLQDMMKYRGYFWS